MSAMRAVVLPLAVAATVVFGATTALAAVTPSFLTLTIPSAVLIDAPVAGQARLVDAAGKPIARAVVRFTAVLGFLGREGEVELAVARTDATGVAAGHFALDSTGDVAVTAAFAGDDQHAASSVTATLTVEDARQRYTPTIGVRVPGLNEPPAMGPTMLGAPAGGLAPTIARLWPAASVWPVAAVLLIVWSIYVYVVTVVLRIAGIGAAPRSTPEP